MEIDGIYACPHVPEDGCECRKPLPGLLLQAAGELGFAAGEAFVIGDKPSDIELGRGLGAVTILVRMEDCARHEAAGSVRADHVADGLVEAAEIIKRTFDRKMGTEI